MNFWEKIKQLLKNIDKWNKEEFVQIYEKELIEIENVFSLLNFGIIVGLPMPPVHITLELLPFMEEEFNLMFSRMETSIDPMGELFSIFDID